MHWLSQFLRRLAVLFDRDRLDRDLQEEIQSHLEMEAEERRAGGMAADQARSAARRQFGNPTLLKETSREAWGWRALDELGRNLKHAFRTLHRSPGFALLAVITLALGIGLNLAVFTVVYKVALRPIAYPAVDRLMDVHLILTDERRGTIPMSWSYPKYERLRWWNRSFDALAAFQPMVFTMPRVDDPLPAELVSSEYFKIAGIQAQLGRTFVAEEDTPGAASVAMLLSDGAWRRYFGGDPGILGRPLHIQGAIVNVVGVMPPGFKGETGRTAVWGSMSAYQNPSWRGHNLQVIGRRKPGVSVRQANEDVRRIAAGLEQEQRTDRAGKDGWAGGARPLLDARVDPLVRKSLWILQAATLCVLLIACLNLANLLLGRGAARRRELAIRLALGTNRIALFRQLMIEPVLLALAGGTAGLFLAASGVRLLALILPAADSSASFWNYLRFIDPESFRLELPMVAFGVLLSLGTGIVFGLLPAWQAARADVTHGLRGGLAASGPQHARLRHALVAAQMALAVVLLAGADLMIRSFTALLATDFGVGTRNVLTMNVQPRTRDLVPRRAFYAELERRAGALPGVESAATSNVLPAYGPDQGTEIRIEGRPEPLHTGVFEVSPPYFGLFRVPIVSGRVFTPHDGADSPKVVVLSESAAQRFFPGQQAVGRRVDFPHMTMNRPPEPAEVVGVVADVKYGGPETKPAPVMYTSTLQNRRAYFLQVRSARDPRTLEPAIRRIARELDPEARVFDVRTVEDIIGAATWRTHLGAVLLGFMAALALTLAAVGIYGVFSYAVAARTRELGVRIAMGAARHDILGVILRQGAALAAIALAVGLPAAWALTGALSSQLYRVSAADPAVYATSAVLLLGVALAACYIPARRATRIDPVEALRHE